MRYEIRVCGPHRYLAALHELPPGLLKAKAEIRIKRLEDYFGMSRLFETQQRSRRQIQRGNRGALPRRRTVALDNDD